MAPRHFLKLSDLSPDELKALIQRAIVLKKLQHQRIPHEFLRNRVLAMLFEKSSTRTRVSFEAAMVQCGGHAIFLTAGDTQLGRGEPPEDMGRVLSRMADAIMIRTYSQEVIEHISAYSNVPVINGLTDFFHPCQILADMQTYHEHRGAIQGKQAAWIGDGNNVCHSYINAARLFDFKLQIACPPGYEPNAGLVEQSAQWVSITHDPKEAAANADLLVTDVWASMGKESEQARRLKDFSPYQVNDKLMRCAKPKALFMHCLPAHRGEEVTHEVIEARKAWYGMKRRIACTPKKLCWNC